MRGASALDNWLAAHDSVSGFVVWEPVLDGDRAPPASLPRHARSFWDPARATSAALRASGADPRCLDAGDADLDVVWDALFLYPAGARWDARPPPPRQCGRTILQTLPSLPP